MINRATQSFTAPGSTYKPCTTIAGMDTGTISSGTTFYCSGSFDKVTPAPKCWRLSGHGGEVAATAIRDSVTYISIMLVIIWHVERWNL